jgi:hypothetical protein
MSAATMAGETAFYLRRRVCTLAAAALGAGLASACLPQQPLARGNRVVDVPTPDPVDEQLKPRGWKTSTIRIGSSFNALASLHFIQNLQLPGPPIPYVTSMTFYAPSELPLVTIGLYYEQGASRTIRDMLTSSALGFQPIMDLDSPLRWAIGHGDADANAAALSAEQVAWFAANRQAIVDAMRLSGQGAVLSKKYDCDFTTRVRPPANAPAALVISGAARSGSASPGTVIAQRLLFVE